MSLFPDVSRWQGNIDFDRMRSKTDYIILKASQADYPDPKLSRNISECNRVGLPYGLYHFYDDRVSPSVQANRFASYADGAVELWCDWEKTYGGKYPLLRDVVAFMQRVEDLTGKSVGMYTGYYWFLENSNATTNAGQYKYLATRPLWLAWYTHDHTNTGIENVRIPKPWTDMDVWQYGTPAIGFDMGAESREIDMNERVGKPPTEPVTVRLVADYNGKKIEYRRK